MNTKKDCCENCVQMIYTPNSTDDLVLNMIRGISRECSNKDCTCHTDSTKKCGEECLREGWIAANGTCPEHPVSQGKESSEECAHEKYNGACGFVWCPGFKMYWSNPASFTENTILEFREKFFRYSPTIINAPYTNGDLEQWLTSKLEEARFFSDPKRNFITHEDWKNHTERTTQAERTRIISLIEKNKKECIYCRKGSKRECSIAIHNAALDQILGEIQK